MTKRNQVTTERAKALRRKETYTEKKLWKLLRDRKYKNLKFRRQHPLPPYIADFYCHQLKLIIELDGVTHDSNAKKKYDAQRDEFMLNQGYQIIRISDDDFIENPANLFVKIDALIE